MRVEGIIEPNGDVLWTAPVRPRSRSSSYVAIVGGRTIYGYVLKELSELAWYTITAHDTDHVDVMDELISEFDGHAYTEKTAEEIERLQRSLVRRFCVHSIRGISEKPQQRGEHPMGVLTLDDTQGTPTLGKMPIHMRKFLDYYIWITK